ncbi:YuiA family protein [Peribacillus sp. FSL H8-0477]
MLIMKGKGNTCEYCSGQGYFQLLLGGSETCNGCDGSGKTGEKS